MQYYEIKSDIYAELGEVTKSPKVPDPSSIHGSSIHFKTGKLITAPIPNPLEFEVDCIDQAPHLLGVEIPIMSGRMAKCFADLGIDNLQLFPAILRNPDTGKTWEDYFAFNVVGLANPVDVGASKALVIMDGEDLVPPVLAFEEVVFSREKTQDLDMFRLSQDRLMWLVSERIMEGLRRMKPDGGWGFMSMKIGVR